MQHYLVVIALGNREPQTLGELSKIAAHSGCSIVNSHMNRLGKASAITLMLTGTWSAIAKLETALPILAKKLDLTTIVKRTEDMETVEGVMPYQAQVIGMDVAGVVHKIIDFFHNNAVSIEEMDTDTYTPAHTTTAMFSFTAMVTIPAKVHIAGLRERFMLFCEDHNLDAILEPLKN